MFTIRYLFIAEKPSLMREVEKCYKNHKKDIDAKVGEIDFVALSGHVCTNYEPSDYDEWADVSWQDISYPMLPKEWKIKVIDDAYKKKTVSRIKAAASKYDGIIVGTDSDVEGYGIYYLLEHFLHLEKKPALRFMEHSLTDAEIYRSLCSMTDYHSDPVHVRFTQSFLLRSRSDWLFGMNGTRMLTVKSGGQLLPIGRVKAPTIRLIYDNSKAIDDFVPEIFFTVQAKYDSFASQLVGDDGKAKRFRKEDDIPSDIPHDGKVTEIKKQRKKTHAPKLFDLASAQTEAGRLFGYTPNETLDIIQSLYEKHKVVSYPRTQCRYVSEEKAREFPDMVKSMSVFPDLAPYVAGIAPSAYTDIMSDRAVVNDKEVQKESHDALLPTSAVPDLSAMSEKEKNVCEMIFRRLLSELMPQYEEDRTSLKIMHGKYPFSADGSTVIEQGWKRLYRTAKDTAIPPFFEGDAVHADEISARKGVTKPPKRLTQATLVDAMQNIASHIDDPELKKSLNESKGIGTPATRASIISDIIRRGFADDRKDGLHITGKGKEYAEQISPLDISSPVFAAKMDTLLKNVQRGDADYATVYRTIAEKLGEMCRQIAAMHISGPKSSVMCPVCGKPLELSRYYYVCPDDGFRIQRMVCGAEITEGMLSDLIDGKTLPERVFRKKDGTKFSACLKYEDGSLKFTSQMYRCPKCGKKTVQINRGGAFCRDESCGLKIFRNMAQRAFSDAELKKLLEKKRLDDLDGFVSKKGTNFSASVIISDEGKQEFDFNKKGKTER